MRRHESRSVDPESSLSFLMVANDSAECINYDPDETFMVSYAISEQTSPQTKRRSLGSETVLSCLQVRMSTLACRIASGL